MTEHVNNLVQLEDKKVSVSLYIQNLIYKDFPLYLTASVEI